MFDSQKSLARLDVLAWNVSVSVIVLTGQRPVLFTMEAVRLAVHLLGENCLGKFGTTGERA